MNTNQNEDKPGALHIAQPTSGICYLLGAMQWCDSLVCGTRVVLDHSNSIRLGQHHIQSLHRKAYYCGVKWTRQLTDAIL